MDLGRDKTVAQIISRLRAGKAADGPVRVEGTWGSFAPMLAAYVSGKLKKPVLLISPHIDDADNVTDDLQVFAETTSVRTFPAWEAEPELNDATDEIAAERLRIALGLAASPGSLDDSSFIISASAQAICQPVPNLQLLRRGSLILQAGRTLSPRDVLAWLTENSYERVDGIDLPGQFAQRGGIIDIYAPVAVYRPRPGASLDYLSSSQPQAVRIEFFADTVESIRSIDLDTQRSSEQLEALEIIPTLRRSAAQLSQTRDRSSKTLQPTELFINILPPDTIIILQEPADIEQVTDLYLDRLTNPVGLYPWTAVYQALEKFLRLHICRFAPSTGADFFRLNVKSTQQFEHRAGPVWADSKAAIDELIAQAGQRKKVFLYCQSSAEIKRITEIITDSHNRVPSNFKLPLGFIHCGFIITSLNTIIVTHHELFGQYTIRRQQRLARRTAPLDTFADLQQGDYVVHASYGIGKFLGIKTIPKADGFTEYLTLQYADREIIHVPVQNILLVQKFVGTTPKRPPLSRLGSKKWRRQKERVTSAIQDFASELLQLQAARQSMAGIGFDRDSTWQAEFEESFPYPETPDQTTVAAQIKTDMQTPAPMDRLLCGDVGYGKTELAMRAAFKAVESGKQVAMLVPTTVLCLQHGRTFSERFADFPISIEILNRFKAPGQARDIINRTKAGKVDILIGTHRILSGDIGFKDLGLLIIDEEQRFGVEHKERLKKLRLNVDVLTMTATPIPRTLHLSLLGIRDISSLTTPPLDRRSIVTAVSRYDTELIKKAIARELNRRGQVFFLHNRVRSIDRAAEHIRRLVPDAKLDIAHGQMPKGALEDAMIKFVLGATDVLLCTTIIESGLDIPNANTIFINDADRFGLAELHQLRGRVGRYKRRAYAYMLLPPARTITPIAARRLKAIEEYSHLGAGFRIALRDLEIRGAGNILGAEQSGHIQTIGYEMYCRLLAQTVKKLKNEPIEPEPAAVINLGFTTYIPKSYIPSDRQRMEVYRRIAEAKVTQDLQQLKARLDDLFGPVPQQVKFLLDIADLRIKASALNIKSIIVSGRDLIFSFENVATAGSLFTKAPGIVRIPDPKTVHLRLKETYFEPDTILTILRKILNPTSQDCTK